MNVAADKEMRYHYCPKPANFLQSTELQIRVLQAS